MNVSNETDNDLNEMIHWADYLLSPPRCGHRQSKGPLRTTSSWRQVTCPACRPALKKKKK